MRDFQHPRSDTLMSHQSLEKILASTLSHTLKKPSHFPHSFRRDWLFRLSSRTPMQTENSSKTLIMVSKSTHEDDSSSYNGSSNDSHSGSGSRPETSTSSFEKEENAAAVLAQREHKHVMRSKALVFVVLLLAACLVGFFTYWFLSQSEKEAFESQV